LCELLDNLKAEWPGVELATFGSQSNTLHATLPGHTRKWSSWNKQMIVDWTSRSFPVLSSSHVAPSCGNFCDTTTTDETDESSEISSPRGAEPHYQFRKSNSMKLALKEEEEEGSYNVVSSTCM